MNTLESSQEMFDNNLYSAFSKKTRSIIRDRDGGRSVESGLTDHLEAAHWSHDRSRSDYDSPDNGRLLTTAEHFWDHVDRQGENGLSKESNDWAIMTIWRRFWGIQPS